MANKRSSLAQYLSVITQTCTKTSQIQFRIVWEPVNLRKTCNTAELIAARWPPTVPKMVASCTRNFLPARRPFSIPTHQIVLNAVIKMPVTLIWLVGLINQANYDRYAYHGRCEDCVDCVAGVRETRTSVRRSGKGWRKVLYSTVGEGE